MRDLKKDLEICEKATPGPWVLIIKGNTVKSYSIDGICYGMKKDGKDARFILEARQGWPEAINRALKAEKEINYQTSELVAYKKENAELKDKLLNSGPWPQFAVETKNKRLEEENAKLREALEKIARERPLTGPDNLTDIQMQEIARKTLTE